MIIIWAKNKNNNYDDFGTQLVFNIDLVEVDVEEEQVDEQDYYFD